MAPLTFRQKLWTYYYDHAWPQDVVEYFFPRTGTRENVWMGNERTFRPVHSIRVAWWRFDCWRIKWYRRRAYRY